MEEYGRDLVLGFLQRGVVGLDEAGFHELTRRSDEL